MWNGRSSPFQPFFHPFLTIFAKNGKKVRQKIEERERKEKRSFQSLSRSHFFPFLSRNISSANPFFCVVSCWQNVKICESLLEMPSFQCIGGGSVPPPITCRTLGRAMRRKARRLPLAEAPIPFSLLYCVNKTLKYVKVCLECPVFNALGAVVCRPQSLAGRWAGRRTERRIAWPWRRLQCNFFVLYRVGKMLKYVSVFLNCAIFIALAAAVYRPHQISGRWAKRCTERCVTWPWWRRQSFFLYRIVLTKRCNL